MRFAAFILFLVSVSGTSAAQDDADLIALVGANDLAGLDNALQAGADPDQRQAAGLQATPLMWATGVDNPRLIEALLDAGATVDLVDAMGDPAINWAAYYGNVAAIELLLAAGADTFLTGHGNAVEIVMRRGHQDALHLLLQYRETLPERSESELALDTALTAGDLESLAALAGSIDLDAARDFAGRPVVQAAARSGAADSIGWLAAHGYNVDATDAIGFTGLFEAARDGQAGAVAALIAAGADVNHVSGENALSLTPLHLAAIGGDAETVELLLATGADPDAQGTMGGTALMWAAFEGSREAARVLLDGGADSGLATQDGTTFDVIASQRGWTDMVAPAEGGPG
ncbi:ankyrin repeat domain-containing protein [Hyphobacterium sp.]|uniref:ankyrin repeat domain-containing protein n=1 Tax=Hyphobacterium sp. TaxID=2004662 RepID=UPI003B52D878